MIDWQQRRQLDLGLQHSPVRKQANPTGLVRIRRLIVVSVIPTVIVFMIARRRRLDCLLPMQRHVQLRRHRNEKHRQNQRRQDARKDARDDVRVAGLLLCFMQTDCKKA